MVDSYSAGGVVINEQGQVVIVNQDGDSWSLPKGRLEPGEDILEAAKREIYEESGISQLEYIKDLGNYQRFKVVHGVEDKSVRKNITMFLFKTKQLELKPIDSENPEARWVNIADATKLLSFEKDKEFLREVLDNQLSTILK